MNPQQTIAQARAAAQQALPQQSGELSHGEVWRKGLGMYGMKDLLGIWGVKKTIGIRNALVDMKLKSLGHDPSSDSSIVGSDAGMGDKLQVGDNQTFNYHGAGFGKLASAMTLAGILGAGALWLFDHFTDDHGQTPPAVETPANPDTDTDTAYYLKSHK